MAAFYLKSDNQVRNIVKVKYPTLIAIGTPPKHKSLMSLNFERCFPLGCR